MPTTLSRSLHTALACTLFAAATAVPAHAAYLTASGVNATTGNPVAASASFTTNGNQLTLVLTNTTPGGTTRRGDLVTGIVFDLLGGSPTLTLQNTALAAGSTAFLNSSSPGAVPVNGSWTTAKGASPIGQYGVATTGYSGAFAASGLAVGSGGEDYAIAAAGTFPPGAGSSNSFNSAFPLFQDSLTFTFLSSSPISDTQIANVRLLFGTSGAGTINVAVPEPTSLLLLALGTPLAALLAVATGNDAGDGPAPGSHSPLGGRTGRGLLHVSAAPQVKGDAV